MTAWRAELAQLTAAGVPPRYPWREWFDGSAHHLARGLDYHVETLRLQASAAAAARRMGVKLRSITTETGCTLLALSLQGSSTVERRLVKPKDDGSNPSPAATRCAVKVVVSKNIPQHMSGDFFPDSGAPCALCGSSEKHPTPAAGEVA